MVGLDQRERVTSGEADAAAEDEMAAVCGVINAATGRLVELIAGAIDTGAWVGHGIRSPEHWVAWKCGLASERARALVAMARRLVELPATRSAFAAGELSADQAQVICRHAPTHNDAEAADLARVTTVTQLRRTLSGYGFATPPPAEATESGEADGGDETAEGGSRRRVSFAYGDDGWWRLSALLPPDEGAAAEAALTADRDALYQRRHPDTDTLVDPGDVTWADAFNALCESALAAGPVARPHRDRHLVFIHLNGDPDGDTNGAANGGTAGSMYGHLHLGPALPDSIRRYLTCDTRLRVVIHHHGAPYSVGRSQRNVPDRTRTAIEERDRGCRAPGCDRTRWLHIHHITHWDQGGPTDTFNLVALCAAHHRQHHQGGLGITGNADHPHGLTFTDVDGRTIAPTGRPHPPRGSPEHLATQLGIPTRPYAPPTGERLDPRWIEFTQPALGN